MTATATETGHEVWRSPSGVDHLVPVIKDRGAVCQPVTSPCATCGRAHNVLHARNVRRYDVAGECSVRLAGWPYECGAKDKHPDHAVYVCGTHSVWWHEPA